MYKKLLIRQLRKHNKKNEIEYHNTFRIMKTVMRLAQCFSIFPVDGVSSSVYKDLRFRWKSWRILYISFPMIMCLVSIILSFLYFIEKEFAVKNLGAPVFYSISLMTIISFLFFSQKWPKFMKRLSVLENELKNRYPMDTKLQAKVDRVTWLSFTASVVTQSLTYIRVLYLASLRRKPLDLDILFKGRFPFAFTSVPYNPLIGIMFFLNQTIATFAWNFTDVFIISMSLIMSSKFKQITARIKFRIKQTLPYYRELCYNDKFLLKVYQKEFVTNDKDLFWKQIREDYTNINNMCSKLNRLLGRLIMVSYGGNSAGIVLQLFYAIRQPESNVATFHLIWSFTYLMARVFYVTLYGSSIYEESIAPLYHLTSVPSEIYNQEIHRLIVHIQTNPASLTGQNFFTISRSLTLSIAAAIVSYELVFLQFGISTNTCMNMTKINKTSV